jgi:hypothetical protein
MGRDGGHDGRDCRHVSPWRRHPCLSSKMRRRERRTVGRCCGHGGRDCCGEMSRRRRMRPHRWATRIFYSSNRSPIEARIKDVLCSNLFRHAPLAAGAPLRRTTRPMLPAPISFPSESGA